MPDLCKINHRRAALREPKSFHGFCLLSRLVKQVKEVTSAVQEEADSRQSALTELEKCSDWLKETLVSVEASGDAGITAEERISRNKVSGESVETSENVNI